MITPKLTACKNCADILPLIDEIDCKIFEASLLAYNNIIFGLNLYINQTVIWDLLTYRRILMYKNSNPDYACNFSVNMIANKIKLLIYK